MSVISTSHPLIFAKIALNFADDTMARQYFYGAPITRTVQFGADNQFTLELHMEKSACSSQIDDDTEKANIVL